MLDALIALSFKELIALVIAGAIGLLGHYLAKLIELRKQTHGITLKSYYVDHVPETLLSVLATYGAIYGTIESGNASLMTAYLIGFTCDSLVNKFRNRAGNVQAKI